MSNDHTPRFDTNIDWRQAFTARWDMCTDVTGVDPETGLALWIADSDYPTAPCVEQALSDFVGLGGYRYGYDAAGYHANITWWQGHRHGWQIEPDWIVSVQGLGNGIAMVFDTWTQIGDGVCYFTPVYHEFRNKTERAERRPVELPLQLVDGRYEFDWDAAEAAVDPSVKVLIFCSPQNPSGRVWSLDEMRQVADFAARHDMILISDEVHADVVFPGAKYVPMDVAAPEHRDRTITLTAASKAFNLPALRCGQAIIPDDALRAAYQRRLKMLDYKPATPGIVATKAALTPEGEEWLNAQLDYLAGNAKIFDDGINAIPGLHSMKLESTFLPWVDFSGTGMSAEEVTTRLRDDAKIGGAPGAWFGTGGESFNRFSIAVPRAVVEDTVRRMQYAFRDLQ